MDPCRLHKRVVGRYCIHNPLYEDLCHCTAEPAHLDFPAFYRYHYGTHELILSPVFSPSLNRQQTKARYSRALGTCVLVDGRMSRDATLATLSSEMILLTFMLAGLVRQRDHYLGRLLFHHVSALFG
jgi:hypothetical protein